MCHHIGVVETAFALGRAALARGQQPRQPAIGGAILGKDKQARAVAKIEPAADDETQPDLLRRLVRAHDAGEAVAVGDRDRAVAEGGGGHHQLGRMRRPAQKREIGGDLQIPRSAGPAQTEELAQAKMPWINQRGVVAVGKACPEQPEAPPFLVLDPVIVADRIDSAGPFRPPPFFGDPLRPVGARHPV